MPLPIQILSYFAFSTSILFWVHLVRSLYDYRLHKDPTTRDYLGLTASSAVYAGGMWVVTMWQGPLISYYMLHFMWMPAMCMIIFYFRAIRTFLGDSSQLTLWIERLLIALFMLVVGLTLIAILAGQSFLYERVPFQSLNTFAHAIGEDLATPTNLMKIIGGLTILTPIIGYLYLARVLVRDHPKEHLLFFGIMFSLLATTNEILGAFGIIQTLPFIFFSKAFEIVRMGRKYHLKAMGKIRDLEDELGQVSKEALTAFVTAGLVHDINNFLGVILLNCETLVETSYSYLPLAPSIMDLASEIKKNALRIVDTSRSYLRLLNASQTLGTESVAVSTLFEGAFELSRPRLLQYGIPEVQKKIAGAVRVQVNQTQIELVLANLINNSADAIKTQEAPWIRSEAEACGTSIRVRVIDSGRMTPELRDRIFSPGFTTKNDGGHGIGLKIAKKLVQAHRGRLDCIPHAEGTCFELVFPAVD